MKDLIAVYLFLTLIPQAQRASNVGPAEQSEFSMEQDLLPVGRPAALSNGALRALEKDTAVVACLEHQKLPDNGISSWFVASEVHLSGSDEADFIVLPAQLKAAGPMQPAPNACFGGPYTVKWWVLRKTAKGYEVVLRVDAHDLKVGGSSRNGCRDIEVGISSMQGRTTTLYRFDGRRYERYQAKTGER